MVFHITIKYKIETVIETSEMKCDNRLWNHAPIAKGNTVMKEQFYESIKCKFNLNPSLKYTYTMVTECIFSKKMTLLKPS